MAKVALKSLKKEISEAMEPHQFGVGCPDACLRISKAVWRCYKMAQEDHELGILQIDMSNAFNSLSRTAILEYVKTNIPALLPWASWMLSSAAVLVCGSTTLASTSGVQQGDPLGPLSFACGLQTVLRKLPPEPDLCEWWMTVTS